MKKIIKISAVFFALILTAVTSAVSFSAAEDELNVNGAATLKKGDKLTYTIYIADVPEKAEDVQMDIYYDSEKLKVDKNTIKHIQGGSPIYNADTIPGQILFNSANGVEGWDLKKKTMLFEVGFDVLGTGDTEITYYIECMDYMSTSTSLDEYTITCEYAVNGETAKNYVPKVNENGSGGDFENHQNGKGAKNGGDDVVGNPDNANPSPAASVNNDNADNNANNSENAGSQNQDDTTVVLTNSSGEQITNPDGTPVTQSESDKTWRYVVIALLVAAIVCCIVLKVALDKKKNMDKDE